MQSMAAAMQQQQCLTIESSDDRKRLAECAVIYTTKMPEAVMQYMKNICPWNHLITNDIDNA